MQKHLRFLLFIPMCIMLMGCPMMIAYRAAFDVKGDVIDIHGEPLNDCIFNFVVFFEQGEAHTEYRPYIKGIHIDSHFYQSGVMTPDPLKLLSNTIVEIDCGQGYEVYRSPLLISYKTLSINLKKIVIAQAVTDCEKSSCPAQ